MITHIRIEIELDELDYDDPVIFYRVPFTEVAYIHLLKVTSVSLNMLDGKRLLSIEADKLEGELDSIKERTKIFYPDCSYTIYYYGEITG